MLHLFYEFLAVLLIELSLLLQRNQEDCLPMGKKKPTFSSSKSSSIHQKAAKDGSSKDNNIATPISKKPALLDSAEKKTSTPKSLHKSVNFTPIRELNRLTSTVIRKIENSRFGANSSKASKDCHSPLRTPTMVLSCFYQLLLWITFKVQFLSTLLRRIYHF